MVRSYILIERGVKCHGLEPSARGLNLLVDRMSGCEKITVWSSMLVVKCCVSIERGMIKSRSGAPCSWSKVMFSWRGAWKSRGLELHARSQILRFD